MSEDGYVDVTFRVYGVGRGDEMVLLVETRERIRQFLNGTACNDVAIGHIVWSHSPNEKHRTVGE